MIAKLIIKSSSRRRRSECEWTNIKDLPEWTWTLYTFLPRAVSTIDGEWASEFNGIFTKYMRNGCLWYFFWHSQRIKDEVLLVEEVVVGVVYVYVKKERKKNKLEKVEERIHRNKKKKESEKTLDWSIADRHHATRDLLISVHIKLSTGFIYFFALLFNLYIDFYLHSCNNLASIKSLHSYILIDFRTKFISISRLNFSLANHKKKSCGKWEWMEIY